MPAALDGLLVLDFSTLLPGPLATLMLAEAGAEVVKIERPDGGDDMRHYPPQWGESGAAFSLLNRRKKSLAVDLKAPDAVTRLRPLIARADVLVEQFRPGVMTRLGLGYDACRALNPRLVYCSITGYGQSGDNSARAGHDLNYQAEAGLLSLSYGSAEQPVVPPVLTADIAGGAYPAVVNILMALRQREATGEGAHLDVAMADGLFTLPFWALAEGQATGRWPGNADSLLSGAAPRYRLYPTADGGLLAVAAIEQKFWDAFCEAIDLDPELRDDRQNPEATTRRVADIVRDRPSAYWADLFTQVDCCCNLVRSLEEAHADPRFQARGLFAERLVNEAGQSMSALPLPIDPSLGPPPGSPASAPALGADNAMLDAFERDA